MKALITLFLLLVVLTGCDRSHIHESLSLAEQQMMSRPDSALHILESVNADKLYHADKAKYALLLSQAYDKNYIDITGDSLVNIAVNYYSDHPDDHRLMLAYYYQGRIYMNRGSYIPAICSLLTSLELAGKSNDFFWCAKNCEQLSDIYSLTYHSGDELTYAHKAYEYYNLSGNELFIRYAAQNLAKAYINANKPLEAYEYAVMTESMGVAANDSDIVDDAHMLMVKSLYLRDDIAGALQIAKGVDTYDLDFQYIIRTLEAKLDQPSVVPIIDIDTCNSAPLINYIYEINRKEGNYEAAMKSIDRLLHLQDSIMTVSLNHNFNQSISDYFRINATAKESQAKYRRLIYFTIIAVLLIALFVALYIFYLNHKKQKAVIAKNVAIAQNLREILCVTDSKYRQTQSEIHQILSDKYLTIDKLCSSYFENMSAKGLAKKISDEVESMINEFSSGGIRVEELQNLVDEHYNNLFSDLKKDLPDLKDADYLLFLYSALGFSHSAIALFLGEDKMESIYNRKARLKTKIKKSAPPRAEEYLQNLNHQRFKP